MNTVKTIVIELRYHSEPGTYERYHSLVDGINDVVGELAYRFSLDILSLSHVVESHPAGHTSITCTAVCSLNEFTKEQIGETLKGENDQDNANLYSFLDAGGYKLSVRVAKISYN